MEALQLPHQPYYPHLFPSGHFNVLGNESTNHSPVWDAIQLPDKGYIPHPSQSWLPSVRIIKYLLFRVRIIKYFYFKADEPKYFCDDIIFKINPLNFQLILIQASIQISSFSLTGAHIIWQQKLL